MCGTKSRASLTLRWMFLMHSSSVRVEGPGFRTKFPFVCKSGESRGGCTVSEASVRGYVIGVGLSTKGSFVCERKRVCQRVGQRVCVSEDR